MLSKTIIAASALLSIAAAVPLQQHNKREVVWETRTDWQVTTVEVYTTVWLKPGETAPTGAPSDAAPAAAAPTHYGHKHPHKHPKPPAQSPPPAPVESSPAASSSPAAAPTSAYTPPVASSPPPPPPPAPTTTKQSPPPAQPTSGGGNYPSNGLSGAAAAGTEYTGDFTWYDTGLGACGITSSSSDHIVAISEDLFDQYDTGNPNNNPLCGKTVNLTGADGQTYPATIVDRCTGCAISDLDLSQDFFNTVTNNGDGRVGGMHWVFA